MPLAATRIDRLARRLLDDGNVDDEVDARLAALKILLAAGAARSDPAESHDPATDEPSPPR
jgi:hypothetical protein